MRRSELERRLAVGAGHACRIDAREVEGCPGYVRTLSLLEGGTVVVEFNVWGVDEGGLTFRGELGSLEDAITYLEGYLRRPFSDWPKHDAAYPPEPRGVGSPECHERFLRALHEERIALPDPARFTSALGWWRQHLPHPARYER